MTKEEIEQILVSVKVKSRMSLKEIKTLIDSVQQDGKVDTEELLKKVGRGPKREVINKAIIQRSVIRKQFDNYDKEGKIIDTSSLLAKKLQRRNAKLHYECILNDMINAFQQTKRNATDSVSIIK